SSSCGNCLARLRHPHDGLDPAQRKREIGRRDAEDEPRDWILEESAVGERVDEQRKEDSSKRQAQSLVAAADGVERSCSTEQDGDVEEQTDDSELRSDRERRRVG